MCVPGTRRGLLRGRYLVEDRLLVLGNISDNPKVERRLRKREQVALRLGCNVERGHAQLLEEARERLEMRILVLQAFRNPDVFAFEWGHWWWNVVVVIKRHCGASNLLSPEIHTFQRLDQESLTPVPRSSHCRDNYEVKGCYSLSWALGAHPFSAASRVALRSSIVDWTHASTYARVG